MESVVAVALGVVCVTSQNATRRRRCKKAALQINELREQRIARRKILGWTVDLRQLRKSSEKLGAADVAIGR